MLKNIKMAQVHQKYILGFWFFWENINRRKIVKNYKMLCEWPTCIKNIICFAFFWIFLNLYKNWSKLDYDSYLFSLQYLWYKVIEKKIHFSLTLYSKFVKKTWCFWKLFKNYQSLKDFTGNFWILKNLWNLILQRGDQPHGLRMTYLAVFLVELRFYDD